MFKDMNVKWCFLAQKKLILEKPNLVLFHDLSSEQIKSRDEMLYKYQKLKQIAKKKILMRRIIPS